MYTDNFNLHILGDLFIFNFFCTNGPTNKPIVRSSESGAEKTGKVLHGQNNISVREYLTLNQKFSFFHPLSFLYTLKLWHVR